MDIYLKEVVEVEKIFATFWKWGHMLLSLKIWTPFFSVRTHKVVHTIVWVKLSRILLDFWSPYVLNVIRIAIGVFYNEKILL
jgi:hypothetical protein